MHYNPNLTLPKSEHQNRQDKITKVEKQTTIKCFKNAAIFLVAGGAWCGGLVDSLGRWVVLGFLGGGGGGGGVGGTRG